MLRRRNRKFHLNLSAAKDGLHFFSFFQAISLFFLRTERILRVPKGEEVEKVAGGRAAARAAGHRKVTAAPKPPVPPPLTRLYFSSFLRWPFSIASLPLAFPSSPLQGFPDTSPSFGSPTKRNNRNRFLWRLPSLRRYLRAPDRFPPSL